MRIFRKPVLTNKLSFVAFLSVLSVIIGAMQARPVLADTISYNAIIASTPVDLSNVSLNFTDFNPSQGTLTGVTLDLTATISNYYTVTGNAGQTARVTIFQYTDYSDLGASSPLNQSSFSLTVSDSNNRITGGPQISTAYNPVFSVSPPTGWTYSNNTVPGGSGPNIYYNLGTLGSSGSASTPTYTTTASSGQLTYADPALLSELTGSGTTPLFVTTLTHNGLVGYAPSGGANVSVGLAGTITYDYTPVPIPGALLLFGPGLMGLAAIRKRVKQ